MVLFMQKQSVQSILDSFPMLVSNLNNMALDRMYAVLERLDNPQNKIPPAVHFAGTNGKGSTVAFTRAILEQSGYTVHVFTSPHLVVPNERIVLGGEMISDDDFKSYISRVCDANLGEEITVFEMIMAVAFLAFSEQPADFVLLETGLGGRYDATNVINDPIATVITPISLDHTHILGDTLEKIATEKACIQKPNRPSLIAPQETSALNAILKYADEIQAKPFVCGQGWGFEELENGGFEFLNLVFDKPSLQGRHQITNAATAVATTMILKGEGFDKISPQTMQLGVISATWNARMQKLTSGEIFETVGENADVWLDGGHNVSAGHAIADFISTFDDERPNIFITAMTDTKDEKQFLATIQNIVDKMYTISIPNYAHTLSGNDLADSACALNIDATSCHSLDDVYQNLSNHMADNPRIFIVGSLYLAGTILQGHK